jgi:hypothetical protein
MINDRTREFFVKRVEAWGTTTVAVLHHRIIGIAAWNGNRIEFILVASRVKDLDHPLHAYVG